MALFFFFFCRAEGVARGSRVLSFSFENQPTMARRQATEETAWLCSPWPRDVAFLPATTPPTPCPFFHELPARRYAQGCSRVLNGICLRFLQEVRLCRRVDTRRGKPRTTHQAPKNRPCARIIKNKGCIFFLRDNRIIRGWHGRATCSRRLGGAAFSAWMAPMATCMGSATGTTRRTTPRQGPRAGAVGTRAVLAAVTRQPAAISNTAASTALARGSTRCLGVYCL